MKDTLITPYSEGSRCYDTGYNDKLTINKTTLPKTVAGVTLGNMVEWFDFAIYSAMAMIMAKVFFPVSNNKTEMIAIYATFAAGFVIRPLGGFIFGPIGDKFGRRTALVASISVMSLSTLLISIIPSYHSIGMLAPVLLVLCRMLQGLSTGGEYGGSCIFISEHSPDKKRTFLTSWLEFGNILGFLVGGIIVSIISHTLGESVMLAWGWRVPFAIAGLMGIVAIFIRMRVDETPIFKEMQSEKKRSPQIKTSFVTIIAKEWKQLLRCAGIVAAFNISYYIILGYIPGYLSSFLGKSQEFSANLSLISTLGLLVFIPLFGYFGDIFGRKRLLQIGCIVMILFSVPAFMALKSGDTVFIIISMCVLIAGMLFFEGTIPATLTSLFGHKARYSCFAISYNLSVSLLGGTAPLLNTMLIEKTGSTLVPAYYLMAGALMGILAMWGMKDYTGKPLPADQS
ncbi:MFS transporter [Pantoea sp. A4]|uniref:MFS transporter n=1 Tax=Pantoea sp. A4 TaxID=1225184 RepID=UPI0003624D25|nr:MFS transporter [Pantoea sp. A4]